MRAVICGANGAMGKLLRDRLGDQAVGLVSLDRENGVPGTMEELGDAGAQVVIDFSHHSAALSVLQYCKKYGCAAVIGTTGHTEQEQQAIRQYAREIPVFYCGNMSLGIAVLCRLAKEAAAAFPDADIEIVETHHNRKADAPSGTAHMIFRALRSVRPGAKEICGRAGEGKRQKEDIGVSSLRMGGIVGVHEVHICTPTQHMTLRHEVLDRGMFADGAVDAARFLLDKPAGLYDMEDYLRT